jgi:hypothetical protein
MSFVEIRKTKSPVCTDQEEKGAPFQEPNWKLDDRLDFSLLTRSGGSRYKIIFSYFTKYTHISHNDCW